MLKAGLQAEGGWWDLQLGAIKGCLDYLGIETGMPSLAGGLGYAFIINIARGLCPSGPYFSVACTGDLLPRLGENLGSHVEAVFGWEDSPEAAQRREEAKELTIRGVKQGLPVYFWAAPGIGYTVIQDADEDGIKYGNKGDMSRKWSEFGGVEFYCISRSAKDADWRKAAREGIGFAIEHSQNPVKWRTKRGDYDNFGLQAYDAWAEAIRNKDCAAEIGGLAVAGLWHRCRTLALEYLNNLDSLTNGDMSLLIDECRAEYTRVAQHLYSIASIFSPHTVPNHAKLLEDQEGVERILAHIALARRDEASALNALSEVGRRL